MKRNVGRIIATAAVGLTLTLGGCTCGNMYSQQDEIKMGQQFEKDYAADRKNRFVTSGPQYDRLQRVAARILPLARKDWDVPYKVSLVDSKEINAFAVPGGPIYFYRGLMDLAGSDDEVASVLGHEATHIVKRHSAKQMSDQMGKSVIAQILLGAGRASRDQEQLAGLLIGIESLRFSRNDEAQADEYGFKYLVTAGYNPDAMATFFEKMGKAAGNGGGPEFLQSHPVTSKRIAAARARAEAYKKGTYIAP
ncbi:MAG: M48 family metalloprotease [Armatimonas sp.]